MRKYPVKCIIICAITMSGLLLLLSTILLFVQAELDFNKNEAINLGTIPELNYLDTSINPCDNFYQFSCGNFNKTHPRPSGSNIIDHFVILEEELIRIGNEILSSPKLEQDPVALIKAKAAYEGCSNDEYLNLNNTPELQTIEEFGGFPLISSSNATTVFGWNEIGDMVGKYGLQLLFSHTIIQLNQNESVIAIDRDGLLNPSLFNPQHQSNYESILEEDFKESGTMLKRALSQPAPFDVFLETVTMNLLRKSNSTKSEEKVLVDLNDMVAFMRALYKVGKEKVSDTIWPLDEFPPTIAQLQQWTDLQFGGDIKMNWLEYFDKIFQKSGIKVTNDIKLYHKGIPMIYQVLKLVHETDATVLKNFALLRLFLFQAPDSDSITRKAFEDYYEAKGYKLYPRWEYCTRKILDVVDTASLNYAVAYNYSQNHFNLNKIFQAATLVSNIRDAFAETLVNSDWMDQESRVGAWRKVQNTLVLLANPDFVYNRTKLDEFYDNLNINEVDNYGNARNLRAFKQAYQFSQVGEPDRRFWGKSTFDPNAYYNRPNNKIVVPIAVLNPLFFYGNNPISDYSRFGSLVGHELTHGFDQNGINYNENGMEQPWWSEQTMTSFLERTQCFEDQYSKYYIPEIDLYINGSYCINENLADNGGVRHAFKAFKKLLREQEIQAESDYTPEQLFFIGFGTMWCSDESVNYLKALINNKNGYAPNRFRVIGSLSNMQEFADAFNCPSGSGMNPEKKCSLW